MSSSTSAATDNTDLQAVERIYERLSITSNETLSSVLTKLLPSLLPLMNREPLRPAILKILSNVTKRVKLLGTKLPCSDLIKLVHSDLKPFACNFAIVMVDISLLNETDESRVDCAVSLVETILRGTADVSFSPLENALVSYSSFLVDELAQVLLRHCDHTPATHILCDWFLDVALYQEKNIASQSSVNSIITPGISSRRLARLREKNDSQVKLKPSIVKKKLIAHLHSKFIYAPISVLLAVLCASDSDPEVVKLAVFKLNGMRNFLHSTYATGEIVDTIRFLLRFSVMDITSREIFYDRYFVDRTLLSDDARSDLLHWIAKEMTDHLDNLCAEVSMVANLTIQQSGCSMRLLAATVTVIEKLSQSKSDLVGEYAPSYIETCLTVLEQCSHSVQNSGEADVTLRKSVYRVLELLLHRFPTCMSSKILPLVDLCFRLLDRELEDMIPRLIGAMGSLRLAYEVCSVKDPTLMRATAIGDIMKKARASAEPMKRITAIQWTLTIFGLRDIRSVETVIILLDDSSESVRNTADMKMKDILCTVADMTMDNMGEEDSLFLDQLLRSFRTFCPLLFSDSLRRMTGPKGFTSLVQINSSILRIVSQIAKARYSIFNPIANELSSFLSGPRQHLSVYISAIEEILRTIVSLNLPNQFSMNQTNSSVLLLCEESIQLLYRCVLVGNETLTNSLVGDILQIVFFFIGKLNFSCDELAASVISIISIGEENFDLCTQIIQDLEKNLLTISPSFNSPELLVQRIPVARGSLACLGTIANMIFTRKIELLSDSYLQQKYLDVFVKVYRVVYDRYLEFTHHLQGYPELTEISVACIKAFQKIFSSGASNLFSNSCEKSSVTSVALPETSSTWACNLYQVIFGREIFRLEGALVDTSEIHIHSLIDELLFIFSADKSEFILKGMFTRVGSRQSGPTSDDNSSTELVCCAIEFLSTICLSLFTHDLLRKVWNSLNSRHLLVSESPNICFALAEALTRLSFLKDPCFSDIEIVTNDVWTQSTDMQNFLEMFINECSEDYMKRRHSSDEMMVSLIEKTKSSSRFSVVFLLVYFVTRSNHLQNLVDKSSYSWEDICGYLISARSAIHISNLFLSYMLDRDGFIQDMSTHGLCHVYSYVSNMAKIESTPVSIALSEVSYRDAVKVIATNTIVFLSKERRGLTPIGFGVAGTTVSGTMSSPTLVGADGILTSLAAAAPPAIAEAVRQMTADRDARDEGNNLDGRASRQNAQQQSSQSSTPLSSVHAEVCKIAKKTGDSTSIFSFLGMIRCDQTFGLGISAATSARYRPSALSIPEEKIIVVLPLLFQSRYHPSTAVNAAMKSLWAALIGSRESELILEHEANIFTCLVNALICPSWKDREAAALALEAFIPSRKWALIEPKLEDLWSFGTRLIDDMQPSVILAALRLMKVLLDHISRACNPEESEKATVNNTIGIVLPLILEKGLSVSTAEVRGFCLGALMKIIQATKSALEEWLDPIISVLVESMSALEPRTLQYMQFHTARLQISEEELEAFRVRFCQESPIQDALDSCLSALNIKTVPAVAKNLCSFLRGGIGLPTRVSSAKSLAFLAEKFPAELGVHAETAFKSLTDFLVSHHRLDIALRKSVLSTLGTLGRIIHEEVLEEVCYKLFEVYCTLLDPSAGTVEGIGSSDGATAIANCLQQIITRSGDRITDLSLWEKILTCAYVGSFDGSGTSDIASAGNGRSAVSVDASKDLWFKIWTDSLVNSGIGTKQQALKKILAPALSLVVNLLKGFSWTRRAQGVAILIDIFSSAEIGSVCAHSAPAIMHVLKLIPGRIWRGQDIIFDFFVVIFGKFKTMIVRDIDGQEEALLKCSGMLDVGSISYILRNDFYQKSSVSLSEDVNLEMEGEAIPSNQEMSVGSSEVFEEAKSGDVRLFHKFEELFAVDDGSTCYSDISVFSSCEFRSWRIGARACLRFLLHEAARGDKQYRLSVARAIAVFPMELSCGCDSMTSSMMQDSPFCKVFPTLLHLIGFEFTVYTEISAAIETKDAIESVPVKSKSIVTVTTAKTPISRSSAALFGSRYGGGGITIPSNPRKRVLVQDRKTVTESVSGQVSSDIVDQKRPEVPLVLSPPKNGEIYIANIVSSSASSVDPAFKAKLIDCLVTGIEYGINASDILDLTHIVGIRQDLASLRVCFIRWARDVFLSSDFWSIRKSSLILATSVFVSFSTRPADASEASQDLSLDIVLHLISVGCSDMKSSQLRVASLVSLSRLVQSQSFKGLLFMRSNSIENIFAIVAQETKAEVIEQGSKSLKYWKLLKLSGGGSSSSM